MRPRRWPSSTASIRPIGGTMQGITAEVSPARAVPFALGLSRRADSDTLAAGPIGRVAVCRFEWEWEKISCNASLPSALAERLPRRSGGSGARTVGLGERGPGNWCSELSGRTQPSASASAQWHLGCTDAMISVRTVLRSCCDSTDSTGADLMSVGKCTSIDVSTGHYADCSLGCFVTRTIHRAGVTILKRFLASRRHCGMINCSAQAKHSPASARASANKNSEV